MNIKDFRLKKILQVGGKSKYVHLMSNNQGELIIKKRYDRNNPDQRRRYKTEVQILKHLQNCDFVPKIIHLNYAKRTIYMTYVGNQLTNTTTDKKALAEKMKELHLEWNVLRHRKGKPNYTVYYGNGTRLNNKVYIIDFGSNHYKIIGKSSKSLKI